MNKTQKTNPGPDQFTLHARSRGSVRSVNGA